MSKDARKTGDRKVSDWHAAHDRKTVFVNRVKAALDKMAADHGPEYWEYEQDFIKLADVPQSDCSKWRSEFSDYTAIGKPVSSGRSRAEKIGWFATKKAAAEARGESKT